MKSLAAAYAVFAALALPALLWAADEPPAATTPTTPTTSTTPAEPAPEEPAGDGEKAEPETEKAEPEGEKKKESDATKKVVARAAADEEVSIEDFKFSPRTITVN